MTSQTALKLLASLSLLTTLAAFILWRQTGVPAPSWIIKLSAAAFVAALVVGLIGQDTRPRLMLRFVAVLFALLGAISVAADVAYPKAGQAYSLLDHLTTLSPSLVGSLKGAVTAVIGAWAWDPLLMSLLEWPASVWFAGLAALFYWAGRPRRRVQIFAN